MRAFFLTILGEQPQYPPAAVASDTGTAQPVFNLVSRSVWPGRLRNGRETPNEYNYVHLRPQRATLHNINSNNTR